tara:strand:+ start:129 stop:1019 length:891 start_codon:yes stop_codon:yes gene_type:complete
MSYVLEANTPPPVIIHLDSRFATQYLETDSNGKPKSTNFTYTLKEPMNVPDHMNLLVSLHTATIPYTFYNVRSGVNNTISFKADGTPYEIQLAEGNYSATGLASVLKTNLEGVSGLSATIDYSRETMKFGFTITGITSFEFDMTSTDNNGAELIGMYETDVLVIPIGVKTLTPKAIDLNDSIHGLYIRQNIATKGSLDNESGVFTNILARLPITTNAGGIIFFTPSSNDHETMVSVPVINTIGIRLTDDRNRSIDLNGHHFQMSIKISYIHKEKLRALPLRRPNLKLTETTAEKKK